MEMSQNDQLYLMGIIQTGDFGILETESTGKGLEIFSGSGYLNFFIFWP